MLCCTRVPGRASRSILLHGVRFSSTQGSPILVETRVDGASSGPPVAVVTFNLPERLNSLTVEVGDVFERTIRGLKDGEHGPIGAIVLTGAGRAFSAGGDRQFILDRAQDTPSRNSIIMQKFYRRFLSIRDQPFPVIAAVNGPAVGAGACLAAACDVRVASRTASFGFNFVRLGIHPGMGATHYLPTLVGPQVAAMLLLTGDTIDAEDALRVGLVAEIVDGDVVERAVVLASRMASAAPVAIRSCVETLRLQQDEAHSGIKRSLMREADSQVMCYPTEDLQRGVAATVGKYTPTFEDHETYGEALPDPRAAS